jgi:lipoate synthase
VLTSVDRDDLADGGARHFASTVELTKALKPSRDLLVECLVGDFQGDIESIAKLVCSPLDVYAHNLETVERLQPFVRDRKASYSQSLFTLAEAKRARIRMTTTRRGSGKGIGDSGSSSSSGQRSSDFGDCRECDSGSSSGERSSSRSSSSSGGSGSTDSDGGTASSSATLLLPPLYTKTSLMLGLGETPEEVEQCMKDIRAAGVDILTLGQYLRPSLNHLAVVEYVSPAAFEAYRKQALALGFSFVAAGPLVRSSYKAGELFLEHLAHDPASKPAPPPPPPADAPST